MKNYKINISAQAKKELVEGYLKMRENISIVGKRKNILTPIFPQIKTGEFNSGYSWSVEEDNYIIEATKHYPISEKLDKEIAKRLFRTPGAVQKRRLFLRVIKHPNNAKIRRY